MIVQAENTQNLGIAFIPGTFPTGLVLRRLEEFAHSVDWTRAKVNYIYKAYHDSVRLDKIPYYDSGQTEIATYISNKYGIPINEVKFFLVIIRDMAIKGEINPKYWKMIKPQTTADKITTAVQRPALGLERMIGNMKVISIVLLIGVGIYLTFPLLKAGRKKLNKRYN